MENKKKIGTVEMREREISSSETVRLILSLAQGCKYAYPADENERGFNRGIDRVIYAIEDGVETDE